MESKECAICYEVIGKTNACVTPCGHEFCFKCMVKSFQTNDSCPLCRTTYLEKDECLHSDSEDEYDDNETLYDSDEDEDEETIIYNMNNTTKKTIIATPTQIAEELTKKGYTLTDIISLWTNRIDREDKRYTQSFIKNMVKDVDNTIQEADEDKYNIVVEREMMGNEDTRTKDNNDGYLYDSIRMLFGEQ